MTRRQGSRAATAARPSGPPSVAAPGGIARAVAPGAAPPRWIGIAVIAIAAIACLLGVRRGVYPFDEGYILYGAQRVADGFVPYRDFWVIYPPGQFYLLALLFRVFGSSVLIVRLADVAVRVGLIWAVYRLGGRLGGLPAGLAAAAIALLQVAPSNFYGYPMFPALLLSVLCVDRLAGAEANRRPLLLAGALAGGATLFRHDAGLYCALAAAAVLGAAALQGRASPAEAARRAGLFASGAAAVVALPALLLLAVVPAGELWRDLVVFPLSVLNAYRSLPPPALLPAFTRGALALWCFAYLPVVGLAVALALGLWKRSSADLVGPALLGLAFAKQGLSRVDVNHMFPATILAAVVLAVMLARSWRLAPVLGAVLTLLVLVAAFDAWLRSPAMMLGDAMAADTRVRSALPRARGVSIRPDEEAAVAWIRSRTRSDEPVFVGHIRHDRIMANDIAFYFLAERDCPTRWFDLCPGVVTTAPVQERIVRDLEERQVRYAVLASNFGSAVEANLSGRSSGVTILDEYLRGRFTPVARFGDYTILLRKGLGA